MKLSISRKKLSLMCLLIPFIEPQFFQTIKWVHFAYKYWGYFILVMLCVCFFANQIKSQRIESDKCTVVLLLYSLWLLASCFKNHTPISIYLSNYVPIIGISLIITIYGKDKLSDVVDAMIILANVMIVINFITVMAFPNGLYTHITEKGSDYYCCFLGYKNPQIRFFLPAIGFNFVSDYFGGKKISFRTCVIILMILLTESRIDSSTSMVGLAVFAILYIVWRKKEKIRRYFELFKLSYFYIAACVASILVVFFNIQSKFSFLIENVLHRNVGLTDRTIIWARVILAIKNNLIWGYGLQSGTVAEYYISATHTHDYMLQIIYTSGLIGFILISLLWIVASHYCTVGFESSGIKMLMLCSAGILVMGITEALTEAPLVYPMLILMAELALWTKGKENNGNTSVK